MIQISVLNQGNILICKSRKDGKTSAEPYREKDAPFVAYPIALPGYSKE